MLKNFFTFLLLGTFISSNAQQKTYCNPVNIDYGYTPIPNFSTWGVHRATADPVIVNYKGDFYLFSTNQWGYWWSNDMLNWKFISKKFLRPWDTGTYDELCAVQFYSKSPRHDIPVSISLLIKNHLYQRGGHLQNLRI